MNTINPCGIDYFLNDNMCYKKCPDDFTFDIFNKKCIKESSYNPSIELITQDKCNDNNKIYLNGNCIEKCKTEYKFNKYNNKCEKTDVFIPNNFEYVYNSYGYLPPPKIINNKVVLFFDICPQNSKSVSYYCYDNCKIGYKRYGDKCYFSKL
jgi:hypothetical protein